MQYTHPPPSSMRMLRKRTREQITRLHFCARQRQKHMYIHFFFFFFFFHVPKKHIVPRTQSKSHTHAAAPAKIYTDAPLAHVRHHTRAGGGRGAYIISTAARIRPGLEGSWQTCCCRSRRLSTAAGRRRGGKHMACPSLMLLQTQSPNVCRCCSCSPGSTRTRCPA